MAKKVYVVWKGRKTGVFADWQQCKESIHEYPEAKYKAFPSMIAAEQAYRDGFESHWGKKQKYLTALPKEQHRKIGKPVFPSLAVDAAWNTDTLVMEYQGVDAATGSLIFREGPFEEGTNNVGEFLAIVHALAHLKKLKSTIPIYSDSRNAIQWVKSRGHRSRLKPTEKNKKIFELVDRAVKWLKTHRYDNQILKWETKAWGENPADFGRK